MKTLNQKSKTRALIYRKISARPSTKIFNFSAPVLNHKNGFTIIEVVVSVTIFSLISLAIMSFFISMNSSNLKTKADREAGENARSVLDQIVYEVKGAKSIYTPTTSSNQLSLETIKYLPDGENNTFIDFFICGSAICLKKESQNPVALTSNSTQVTGLTFTQIANVAFVSVKIDLTVTYPNSDPNAAASINLTSTASLRSY